MRILNNAFPRIGAETITVIFCLRYITYSHEVPLRHKNVIFIEVSNSLSAVCVKPDRENENVLYFIFPSGIRTYIRRVYNHTGQPLHHDGLYILKKIFPHVG